ncbi:hypothetical protein ELG78_16740 [Rhizobium leguminosarum]|uniref:phage tail length tape measure family protein n=1 Tax=Rhizobium leguminosarum TaxID=384 RepID=UPI00102F4812|nr:phage tail length tape measure family protein [Rhizobium leguminosarum]TBG38526.1 hypothetical protein ELG78_16740 [Rhizobium leguminosarum]
MASPAYKLSIGVNIDPAGAKSGGAAAQAAVAAIGTEAQATATKLQQLINSSVGLNTGVANQNVREWTGALAAQGKAVDDLRSRYNPLFAVIREYKSSITEIRTLHAQGVLSTNEMASAITRERQATLASIDALKGRNAAARQGGNDNNAGFRRQNLGYQLTDIAQTGFLGAPIGMIAAQQLPQIAQIYAGSGGLKTALKDVGALAGSAVSAVGALPLAMAAAGTAAVLYAKRNEVSLASVDEALEKHRSNIEALGTAYGIAEQRARSYSEADRAVANASTQDSLEKLNKLQVQSARELRLEFGSMQAPGKGGQSFFNLAPDYKPFKEAFDGLDIGIRSGRIEGEKFIETVSQIGKVNPAYEEFANKILKTAQTFLSLNAEIKKSQDLLTQIGNLPRLDPLGLFSPDRDAQEQAARTPSLFQQQQARIAAFRQQSAARSPAELEAAARASAEAQFNPSEGSTARADRIELAGVQARIAAERQLRDAQEDRARSLDSSLKSKELELTLIGRTVSETERLRMEQQLISQLEEEAAKNHTTVNPKEIAAIKEKAAAYGQLSEQIAAANLFRDQGQQLDRIKAEISLVGASDEARRRGIATLEAEQQLVSRGIGLNTSYAESYRANAVAISDMTNQLRKQNEAWDKVQGSAENTIDKIIDGLASGDIDDALADIAKDISSTFLELAVKNPAKNALLGTDYGTISDVGGLGGIFSRLFGGEDATAIPGLGKSVGSMSVNAGTVMINGGVAGLGGLGSSGTGGGILSKIFGANDNSSAGSSNMAAYRQAIKDIESSGGNYDALGPLTAKGDRAYGAYQVMGGNIPSWTKEALGRRLTPNEFLADHSAQDSVFDRFFGKSLTKYGNPQDAASVWFTGRPQGRAGNAADILGTTSTKYVEKFNSALGKLDTTTVGATQNLGTFGSGIGQFGQNLANAFPPAPTGGGGGNWLSNLFGGLFGSFTPIGAQATLASNGGIGLYDRGGWTGAGAVDEPAGVVHRGEIVWSQKDIARNGGPETVEAMRLGKRGYLSGGMVGGGVGAGGHVGGQPIFQIINQTSTPISGQVEESQDESGRRNYRLTMSDEIGNAAEQKGGGFRRTMNRQYGLRSAGIAR